jgi:hypothetical protein
MGRIQICNKLKRIRNTDKNCGFQCKDWEFEMSMSQHRGPKIFCDFVYCHILVFISIF